MSATRWPHLRMEPKLLPPAPYNGLCLLPEQPPALKNWGGPQGPQESMLAPETSLAVLATSGGLARATVVFFVSCLLFRVFYSLKGCFLALELFCISQRQSVGSSTFYVFCFLFVCLILSSWDLCSVKLNLAMESSVLYLEVKVLMRNTGLLLVLSPTYTHDFPENLPV